MSIRGGTGWFLVVLGQYGGHWLIYDGTGSEEGGTVWYLVVLGEYVPVLVDI